MPIFRSKPQGGGAGLNLREFYTPEEDTRDDLRESYASMRSFIERLDAEFKETEIWLITSHDRLVLMDVPEYDQGDWHVTISALGEEFSISYLLPEIDSPLPYSEVQATAHGLDAAFRYAVVAMANTGGWNQSQELRTSRCGQTLQPLRVEILMATQTATLLMTSLDWFTGFEIN